MTQYRFTLFIAGKTPRSDLAVRNLHRICEVHFAGRCQVEIVDVLENPALAEQERVLATPTLVKVAPAPERRIIGDLTESTKVLLALDVEVRDEAQERS